MAASTTPRSTVHAFWTAFVPSIIFLLIYGAIFVLIVGTGPLVSLQRDFTAWSATGSGGEAKAILRDFDLFKLIPIAIVFMMTLVLYLFDRLVLSLGNMLPPRPIWNGSSLAW